MTQQFTQPWHTQGEGSLPSGDDHKAIATLYSINPNVLITFLYIKFIKRQCGRRSESNGHFFLP